MRVASFQPAEREEGAQESTNAYTLSRPQATSATTLSSENKPEVRKQEAKRRGKRIHLRRNPLVCVGCFKVWDEEQDSVVKRLFNKSRGQAADAPVQHKGCRGHIKLYYELSGSEIVTFMNEKLLREPEYRDFFPVMSNLIREDAPDTSHHNDP